MIECCYVQECAHSLRRSTVLEAHSDEEGAPAKTHDPIP